MTTLKLTLAAALVMAATTASFAEGLTDKDPQFVNTQSLTNTFVPASQSAKGANTSQSH